jgi:putative ABC transport system permease protein
MTAKPMRSLLRVPGFALAVIATLALGVGALITTFTLVDAALWRLPPLENANRIALLYVTRSSPRQPFHRERWSYPAIQQLKAQSAGIGTIANYSGSNLSLTGIDQPEWLTGEIVSPEYFLVVGAAPVVGRTFLASEDVVGANAVVVLGHELWQRRFAGDRSIVGRAIQLRGIPLTVVGVMPAGFRGITDKAEYWIPTVMAPRLTYDEYLTTRQNFISVVARLGPGIDITEARSALAVFAQRMGDDLSEDPDSLDVVGATAMPLNEARIERNTRRSLLLLFGAVALLYLLACANAANLMLGRAANRRREAAILSALGGAPSNLWRHFLPEGIALVLLGCLAGLGLAGVANQFVSTPTDVWGPRNFYGSIGAFAQPSIQLRALGFTAVLFAMTLVLVAWAPAVSAARVDILTGLRDGSRGASSRAATLRRPSLRGFIVALEAALAMLLLVGGGLMIDSFRRMRQTDLGVNTDRVLTFWLRPNEVRIPPEAAPAFVSQILNAISRVPGVVAATVDGGAPVSGTARSTLYIPGRGFTRQTAPPVLRHYVAPDHFKVLGIPLVRGRVFTDGDIAGRPRVAVISESAARRYWPGQDPLGQRVWFGGGSDFDAPERSAEIVGIVADVVHEPLDVKPNRNEFYTPYMQFTYASRMVMIRTSGNPMDVLPGIRAALRTVDADLPMVELRTLNDLIGRSWSRQRFDAALFGSFALLALLLASSGIYAVVAYAVAQRTREMGIRMALGAQPAAILRLVIREGMTLPVVGLIAGTVGAFVLSRFLQATLYEIKPTDPGVFAASIVLLTMVAALACLTPAFRATRQDPLITLRSE